MEPKKYFEGYISANYKDSVFVRTDFLRLVVAPNGSPILVILYILYDQILSSDQNNFAGVTSEVKKYFNGYISAMLIIRT